MERIFKVTLEYENIESGGGTHYTKSYTLHAKSHPDAAERGIEKLGCIEPLADDVPVVIQRKPHKAHKPAEPKYLIDPRPDP